MNPLLNLILELLGRCSDFNDETIVGRLVRLLLRSRVDELPARYQLTRLLLVLKSIIRHFRSTKIREKGVELLNYVVEILRLLDRRNHQTTPLPELVLGWRGSRDYYPLLLKVCRFFVPATAAHERANLRLSELQLYQRKYLFVGGEPRNRYRIRR